MAIPARPRCSTPPGRPTGARRWLARPRAVACGAARRWRPGRRRGWAYLRRLGQTPQVPRPAHAQADPVAQDAFTKRAALRLDLRLRLRAPRHRRDLLAPPADRQRRRLSVALAAFARAVGAGAGKRIALVRDGAGWQRGAARRWLCRTASTPSRCRRTRRNSSPPNASGPCRMRRSSTSTAPIATPSAVGEKVAPGGMLGV